MSHKILGASAIILSQLLGEAAHANPPTYMKTVQFYAGVSGGGESLSGKRSESLTEPLPATNMIFSRDKSLGAKVEAVYSAMTGFLWNIHNTPLSIGPELYLGQGRGASYVDYMYEDAAAGEFRSYQGSFERKSFCGLLVRGGVRFCQDEYLTFISLGVDYSNVQINRSMNKDAAVATPGPRISDVRRSEVFAGFLYGIGMEKKVGSFTVGAELRGIKYKHRSYANQIFTSPGLNPGATFLKFSAKPQIYSLTARVSYLF